MAYTEPNTSKLEKRHAQEIRDFLAKHGVSHWVDLPTAKLRHQFAYLIDRQARELREAYGRDPVWAEKTPERLAAERKTKESAS